MTLQEIEKILKTKDNQNFLFTYGNMFINEDILPEENPIYALTGFSGSYAILFVTKKKTYLFVDGRYELQAKKEVSKKIEIVKLSEICFADWLKQNFAKKKTEIVYNAWSISLKKLQELSTILPNAKFIASPSSDMLLTPKTSKSFSHQKKYAGLSDKEKISAFTAHIKKLNLDGYLITSASNASWLLNLRADDLPYTPILRCYTLIKKDGSYDVFTLSRLKNSKPFSDLKTELQKLTKIGADFSTTPAIIKTYAQNLIDTKDIITDIKAVKNKTELKSTQNAHLKDGIALTKFLYWLSKNYANKTETEIADKLLDFRKKELNFYSESFATIAGVNKNSAIVHYHAKKETASTLTKNSILLLDSGGQYYDGTTDVTRTIALGKPTPDMIEKNTLVLKAHIALASAVFPPHTTGDELDLLAREPLLKRDLNFEHGTGHGVGFFSNVHEGPARISINAKHSAPLKEGMITSIEPGYYKENDFGIRIENLYAVQSLKNKKYLGFNVLTLVPLDKTLINKYLLTEDEIKWLNRYHRQVFLSLKKYLTKQELLWFKEACAPL